MTMVVWATPGVDITEPVAPRTIILELSPKMLLAMAAALNTADDESMEQQGYSKETIAAADQAFDVLDRMAVHLFGHDWNFKALALSAAQRDLFDTRDE